MNGGTPADHLRQIDEHLASGSGCLHVATVNPEYVMAARTDGAFAAAIQNAELITVDGAGLAVALRLLYPGTHCARMTGVDLTDRLAMRSAHTDLRLYLLGARPGVAIEAADVLLKKYPGAKIVGTWADGTPAADHDGETLRRIRESGANGLLVAYGAPKQVIWIQRNLPALEDAGIRIVSGIGGAFDYISGRAPYAPSIVRRLGMEWLYRLVHEPWRWRRQRVLPLFALLVMRDVAVRRLRRGVN